MAKLELTDCLVEYRFQRSGIERFGPNNHPVLVDDKFWFTQPYFLASLPAPTFGELRKFLDDNVNELVTWMRMRRSLEDYGDLILSGDENLEVITIRQDLPNNSFTLFPKPETEGKPTVTHEGIRTIVDGQFVISIPADPEVDNVLTRVRNYSWRPDRFNFMSMPKERTPVFFGMELEVNSAVPWSEIHKVMTQVEPFQEEFIYAKEDSSISGRYRYSYELVSHPMTPRRLRLEYRKLFTKIEKLVKDQGKSLSDVFDMDTPSTGIHIHVSNKAFNMYDRTHMKKFVLAFNDGSKANSRFISSLACRDTLSSSYCRPDAAFNGRKLSWCLSPQSHTSSRRSSCNSTSNTQEIRIFSGEPTLKHINHCIDTVEAMFNFTAQAPFSAFNMHFKSAFTNWLFKTNRGQYRTLKENIKCA